MFPWTKEREMSLHSVVVGIPRTQGGPNEDQIIQWVITKLNRGQGLACLNQRKLGSWYQGFPRGKTVETNKQTNKALEEGSYPQERVGEWGHENHEGLEELWDYRQLQGERRRRGQERLAWLGLRKFQDCRSKAGRMGPGEEGQS